MSEIQDKIDCLRLASCVYEKEKKTVLEVAKEFYDWLYCDRASRPPVNPMRKDGK